MGKKKQPDFQKAKLRVGRALPKGRNVTDTSFKSMKITVPDQKIEKHAAKVNLKEQLKLLSHHSTRTKLTTLQWISHYIQGNFSIEHLPLILEKAEKVMLDIEHTVRCAAVKLLDATLSNSPSWYVEGHMQSIVCGLRCGMTHCDINIRKDALLFLDVLLRTHPHLLSRYHSLLSVVLDMIASRDIKTNHRKRQKRSLPAVYDDHMKSQSYRLDVLKRFLRLLSLIVKSYDAKDESFDEDDGDDDERTVYWSADEHLSLELFSGGGLKPLEYDLTKDLKFLSINADNQVWTPEKLKLFIDEITPVLMDIFAEEASESLSPLPDPWLRSATIYELGSSLINCVFPTQVAENVSIIVQIFCDLGKWIKILSKTDYKLEAWFVDKFFTVWESFMKGFPYSVRIKNHNTLAARTTELAVVRLNMALCFLCCGFSVERSSTNKYCETILKYLVKVAKLKPEIQADSIPMIIQIARVQLRSQHMNFETANSFLCYLCETIRKPNHIADKLLMKFFTEIVTDINLNCYVALSTKECFFKTLLEELISMSKSNNLDLNLLKYIQRIYILDPQAFLKVSEEKMEPKTIMSLFRLDNEELHEIAAFLLCSREDLDINSLPKISEYIVYPEFSLKAALYVIGTLSKRYAKQIEDRKETRIASIKFLLNVAADTFAITDVERWENEEDLTFSDTWPVVENHSSYKIIPTAHWKKHSKLFEECMYYLRKFPKKEVVQCCFNYCRTILVNYSVFPVHAVIALWKLKTKFLRCASDRQFKASYDSLLFSCMLYCGVYAHDCRNRENFMYGVTALLETINIQDNVTTIMTQLEVEACNIENFEAVEFFLRIIYFLISMENALQRQHQSIIMSILHQLHVRYGEALSVRPLWLGICDCFES